MTHKVMWVGFAPADLSQETMWDGALSPALRRAIAVIDDAYQWGRDLQEDVEVLLVIGPSDAQRVTVMRQQRSKGVRQLTVLLPTNLLPARAKRYIMALHLLLEVLEVVADELGVAMPKLRERMQPPQPAPEAPRVEEALADLVDDPKSFLVVAWYGDAGVRQGEELERELRRLISDRMQSRISGADDWGWGRTWEIASEYQPQLTTGEPTDARDRH